MPIPTIDFSSLDESARAANQDLIHQVRDACQSYGFFQLYVDIGSFNRGYEPLRAQNFERNSAGDLKEGYYFGLDLPLDHPKIVAGKFNLGPNKYPDQVEDAAKFRRVIDEYFGCILSLAEKLFRVICRTLEVDDDWVSGFLETPIATLRLLHYPPQAPNASQQERGIGAHTDFGAITILLQDMVGGLQVWDRAGSQWIDVTPAPGALIVNLGDLMKRWTNDRYMSNLHRVINKSGRERYSVPFFLSGDPDFLVECFPDHRETEAGPKYSPVTVEQWISRRYADTYGASKQKDVGGSSVAETTLATS